jgi:hypothetical protein
MGGAIENRSWKLLQKKNRDQLDTTVDLANLTKTHGDLSRRQGKIHTQKSQQCGF